MSRTRCIIIEDEPLAAKVIQGYVARVPFLDLAGTFRDAMQATEFLRSNQVDLVLLDIHLPKLKGMAFLKTLKDPPAVIIITAYHQYAVEGFELNVTDYLLKPVRFERFLEAVNKINMPGSAEQEKQVPPPSKDYLFVNAQSKKVKIMFADILFVESQKEYVRIVTTKKEYISRLSTHDIENLLPTHLFKRVHRSFIISVERIESFTAESIELNGHSIPVGRAYKDVLNDL